MTERYYRKVNCDRCGHEMTEESAFGRWMRNHEQLLSQNGYVFSDLDYVAHRYKVGNDREIQFMMAFEVKTRGAEPKGWQDDTLGFFNRFIRNRRKTPGNRSIRDQAENRPEILLSKLNKRFVIVRAFGMHLLQFSGTYPPDSREEDGGWIKWDRKKISEETLIGLLQFNVDPDSLAQMDLRKHHIPKLLHLFDSIAVRIP